ncbi:MAG TPA: hypothetical protein VF185_03925 [Patescibacteria group bacterium]
MRLRKTSYVNIKVAFASIVVFFFVFFFIYSLVLTGKVFDFFQYLPFSPYGTFVNVPTSKGCDNSLWNHVYSPSRLYVVSPCITISGTITKIERESDGDDHILLKVDSNYPRLTNIFNKLLMKDNIVMEIICKGEADKEAKESCQNYTNKISTPEVGSKVTVTGSFVVDKPYGWTEIHPVSKISTTP